MKMFSRILAKPVFLNPLLLFEASIGGREIHRTDSSGSDITRFKFTGQEEDKESGLMYYKARYYGLRRWACGSANKANMRNSIGRFLQADSVIMPQSMFGMSM